MIWFGKQIRREAVLRKTDGNISKIENGGGVGRGGKRGELKMKPYVFFKYSTTVRPNHSHNLSLILAWKERYLCAQHMQAKHCFRRAGHKENSLLAKVVLFFFKTTGPALLLSHNGLCLLGIGIVKNKVERFHVW